MAWLPFQKFALNHEALQNKLTGLFRKFPKGEKCLVRLGAKFEGIILVTYFYSPLLQAFGFFNLGTNFLRQNINFHY